ncbi:MAG: hypothetical protein LUG18_01870 [Candidatus Azobacteroides sp.]|nr:hypothetical protein [Candidatus Azobacteroides sp.]
MRKKPWNNSKKKNSITELSNEANIFLQIIREKDSELSKLNLQLSSLKNVEDYLLQNSSGFGAVPGTLGLNDPILTQLITQLVVLESERTRSLQTLRPDNPIIIGLDGQIQNLKNNIYSNIRTLKGALEANKKSILSENASLEKIIKDVPRKERQLLDITRQQNIKNELYIYLLSRREEVALSHAATVSDSRLIDRPIAFSQPVKPVKRNILLMFTLLGLLFPIVIIYLKDIFQNKIESKNDITKNTSIPIIGEVSLVENKNSLVINQEVQNKQAEQLRTLRTNLQFLGGAQDSIKTLLVTSNTSGEGKTFISLNLGASLALTKKKTVILGLDLRRPMLQNDLKLKNTSGLSVYLSGHEQDLNKITYSIPGFDNYFVIPGGPVPPNPIELLMGERMNSLFNELERIYDYIISG